ncbi:MAG: (2Fe-2S)-binding protein [Rhodobacteraceae bacterium]|nr:(2Fe-2S)-binding protein [Paracoccaceae bacterium]
MIICSCNIISDEEIRRAAAILRKDDPQCVITPGLIFKTLGRRPKCGTCIPNFVKIVHDLF